MTARKPKHLLKPAGRPTVFTEDVIKKIEEVAALDGSVEEMAYYAGVNRGSLYSYLQNNPTFSDRIQALRERPVLKARQTVVKSLDNPDTAFRYLERKRKNEFSTRTENETTINIVPISGMQIVRVLEAADVKVLPPNE